MQIETTVTTTETLTVLGSPFKIKVIERQVTAFCDCCSNQATGSQDGLSFNGWHLGAKEQFCPECNF